MKRKRRDLCPSPFLDESPKRTKVQAQRKFAAGSNVNSPVITPIRELEYELPKATMPEPVELLPMKRPNTEDFLTFLCFRGTPILPPSLNFFNTASIVDNNGQVHEIKSEASHKNGPIDIAKCGTSSEKPFIAFGVRKRADPIVISRQMEKKRRHALALQALRRKYQEQKMAKIRALTISKLSEKTTNKTLVKTNTVSKTETVLKKSSTTCNSSSTVQKTKVVATKHVKVTTETLKTATLRPKMKPKMCLRSFRGRFVQKELPLFRKRTAAIPESKKIIKKIEGRKLSVRRKEPLRKESKFDNEGEKKKSGPSKLKEKDKKDERAKPIPVKQKPDESVKSAKGASSPRVTRSSQIQKVIPPKLRQKINKRILLTSTMIKPSLRNTTLRKTVISQREARNRKRAQIREKILTKQSKEAPTNINKQEKNDKKETKVVEKETPKNETPKKVVTVKKESLKDAESQTKPDKVEHKKELMKNIEVKKEYCKTADGTKKETTKNVNIKKKETTCTKDSKDNIKQLEVKRLTRNMEKTDLQKETKNLEVALVKTVDIRTNISSLKSKKELGKSETLKKVITKKTDTKSTESVKDATSEIIESKEKTQKKIIKKTSDTVIKKDTTTNKKSVIEETIKMKEKENNANPSEPGENPETSKKPETVKRKPVDKNNLQIQTSQRPTRKTKEAAAIYMEILSHKLVNDSHIDDDNVSIDSFPELPNVKRTEQRENELKAQAKTTKTPKGTREEEENNVEEKTEEVSKGKKDLKPKNPAKDKVEEKQKEKTEESLAEDVKDCVIKSKNIPGKRKTVNKPEEIDSDDEVLQTKIKKTENKSLNIEPKEEIPKSKTVPNSDKRSKKTEPVIKIEKDLSENKEDNLKQFETKQKMPENQKQLEIKPKKSETNVKPIETPKVPAKTLEKTVEVKKEAAEHFDISDEEVLQAKIDKCAKKEKPTQSSETTNRQTRYSSQNLIKESDDSDESFHAEIRIPCNKKITRSKAKPPKSSPDNEPLKKVKGNEVLSDSDQSTTSDVNLKQLQMKTKNKKFTKTKSDQKNTSINFSDSDEEPLSKLTKSVKSLEDDPASIKPPEEKKLPKKKEKQPQPQILEGKPKRECAKRPSNYLPMFSSSDDEEDQYFHGFSKKTEVKKPLVETLHVASSLDLLCKDAGRKGKVNMSNEQIEKWLNDAALAGSSIKTENDAMLKFGERIPTETTLQTNISVDTQNLKETLIDCKELKEPVTIQEDLEPVGASTPKTEEKSLKQTGVDRKLIFRKDKKVPAPNLKAFSPENECSVYAFGEENDEVISTPFRRPSRRPSSTATSKSEDESLKHDDSKMGHFRRPSTKLDQPKDCDTPIEIEDSQAFNVPQNPSKRQKPEPSTSSSPMVAPATTLYPKKPQKPLLDASDDIKYKIPSSPSASSSSSAKLCKKPPQKSKVKSDVLVPTYVSDFPKANEPAKMVEAPVFHPTEQEFQDPLEYIERIRHKAEQFGICRIVPPSSFKPECKVSDDMRFTAYNQYVHKMFHRWGPNFKEFMAIKKYLATQSITLSHPPCIGGMEVDLPRLYQTVQTLGGLKEVIEKKKWPRVSDMMRIPKSAQDRVTKLDDIYCKYLLPYDTLSPAEREKLFDEVETDWAKRESKNRLKNEQKEAENAEDEEESDDDAEECIVKGRNMALNAFYRIARNTMAMYFKSAEPSPEEVEQEFWKYITQRQNHICVHSGSIDCGNWGYGFPTSKNSPFARHAWNLKVLTNNSGSVLRSLGPVVGVTVPTLHVGMVFSAGCWSRDPHGLPWIEWAHAGGRKVWYAAPAASASQLRSALGRLLPFGLRRASDHAPDEQLQPPPVWLPSDTAMVPPKLLVEGGVSLCRAVQEPGQFIVVFPRAFTATVCTGYMVSESVYFAPPYWLKTARTLFNEMHSSCEPSMFSLDRLLVSIAQDTRSSVEVLRQVGPHIQELADREKEFRRKLGELGEVKREKLPPFEGKVKKKKKVRQGEDGDYECEVCRMNLFVSMVVDTRYDSTYCLEHGISIIDKDKTLAEKCKLLIIYDDEELNGLTEKVKTAIDAKLQKKVPSKYAGMPTLLK